MQQKEKGSYTVEGAFVVPVVLGLIFIIMYTLFLLHDKAVLQANLEDVIFLLAEGEIEEDTYNECLSQGLWFTELETVNIKDGKIIIRGEVKGTSYMEIPGFSKLIGGKQEIALSENYCKIQPELVIRFGKKIVGDKQ